MKKPLLFLLIAIVLAAGAFFVNSWRVQQTSGRPGASLDWLKKEFHIPEAEFNRIREAHESYRPKCREMCGQLEAKNRELKQVLAVSHSVTPEVEKVLAESAQLRQECQKSMLAHFFEVSRMMPPEQGRRYLDWVEEQTILASSRAMHQP